MKRIPVERGSKEMQSEKVIFEKIKLVISCTYPEASMKLTIKIKLRNIWNMTNINM